MGNDSNWARGFFNNQAEICIFPGKKNDDCTDSKLSNGWSRECIEPHTANSKSEYTSTTGWWVEGSLTGDIKPKYTKSYQVKRTIEDFSVRNISDGSMTGWLVFWGKQCERDV